ncbi:hypothetical protein HMPREF0208_04665 [Citrobacter koseri]|nr:hypothetical protein HMPREF0208_04665 [Citrobacter koseri]
MLTAAEKKIWLLFLPHPEASLLLTFHSFLSLQGRSHLTRLHKVATWWIFLDNYQQHISEQQE